MATVDEALRYELLTDADVTALVGSRIHANHAPQGTPMPYIVFHRVSTERVWATSGPIGLAHPRIQFDCVASRYGQVRDLANAVRRRLDNLNGDIGAPGSKVAVNATFIEDESDIYIDPTDASDTGRHLVPMDLIVWHEETT